MKHLFLQGSIDDFMVYYQPKDKGKLCELIYKRKQQYINEKESADFMLHLLHTLYSNGYKVVDITKEVQNIINVNNDLNEESFVYRGITITQSRQYSCFSFYIGKTFYTLPTLEEAIETIDKELK